MRHTAHSISKYSKRQITDFMFKLSHLLVGAAALLLLVACDDNTATLGIDMMPKSDLVSKNFKTYDVTTESYPVGDAVLARTTMSYLGRFTDPETNTTVKSDFLAQFHIDEGFDIPTTRVRALTFDFSSTTLWETPSKTSSSASMS